MKAYEALFAVAEKVGWPEYYRDDLVVHDKAAVEESGDDVPYVWVLRDRGTHLVPITGTWDSRSTIEAYVKGFDSYGNRGDGKRWFTWCPKQQRLEEVDSTTAAQRVQEWAKEYVTYVDPVPNQFEVLCPEHLAAVEAFAKSVGAEEQLVKQIDYLRNYGGGNWKIRLGRDWAQHSFTVTWLRWSRAKEEFVLAYNGGLLYGGPGQPRDGSAPAFSVSLDSLNPCSDRPLHDWSIHT